MKKLLIDLDTCSNCGDCGALCSYIHHPGNNGIVSLREFAHFAILCRRCDDAPCAASCPWEALEIQDYNALKRYTMRCTSCKSCSMACPFGVIYPETIPFITARCDFCIGRLGPNKLPVCLEACTKDGVKYGEFEESDAEHVYKVSEHVLVKTNYKWEREPKAAVVKQK